MKKVGIIVTHPIQYFNELFSELSKKHDVVVFYSHQQTSSDEIKTPFGLAFSWSGSLLDGYNYRFLENTAKNKNVSTFFGCNNPQIYQEIADGEFDFFLVLGWHSLSYVQAILACKITRTPVYVRTDSTLDEPRSKLKRVLKMLGYPLLLKIPAGFLFVGERSRAFLRHYGVKSNKLHFSPHSVGFKNFYPDKQASSYRPKDRSHIWRILSVSALIKLKNIDDVIKACDEVIKQGYRVQLDIVGSGEMEDELRDVAAATECVVNFHSFKNQDELRDYYVKSDILVLASSSESWGLVVNEAMQCGVPALVSDSVGCAPDLIKKDTGRIFRTGNISDLALQMVDLMNAEDVTSDSVINHIKKYSVHSSINAIDRLLE
jgi:glycosyltransferase involved in cell wall biosynthesis